MNLEIVSYYRKSDGELRHVALADPERESKLRKLMAAPEPTDLRAALAARSPRADRAERLRAALGTVTPGTAKTPCACQQPEVTTPDLRAAIIDRREPASCTDRLRAALRSFVQPVKE